MATIPNVSLFELQDISGDELTRRHHIEFLVSVRSELERFLRGDFARYTCQEHQLPGTAFLSDATLELVQNTLGDNGWNVRVVKAPDGPSIYVTQKVLALL